MILDLRVKNVLQKNGMKKGSSYKYGQIYKTEIFQIDLFLDESSMRVIGKLFDFQLNYLSVFLFFFPIYLSSVG